MVPDKGHLGVHQINGYNDQPSVEYQNRQHYGAASLMPH